MMLVVVFYGEFFSFVSPYPINVSFKVAVVYKLGKNVLHKGRNGTRVKSELHIKFFNEMFG